MLVIVLLLVVLYVRVVCGVCASGVCVCGGVCLSVCGGMCVVRVCVCW